MASENGESGTGTKTATAKPILSEKELQQILVLTKRATEGRQLDYIFVSDR